MIQLLAFIGLVLTFNLCTQIAKSFAVYYFKYVCHDEYLYSIFGFAIIAEMAGLLCFPKSQQKISREKSYTHLHADFRLLDLYCSVQQDM